ncbi:MAG: extracellular solute-binding protein [Clostridiaceae bacterium]|nr:extracellular solute-binding protein [Clostridiaceae bacterium]
MSKEEAFRRTLQMFRTNKPDAIISTSESITRGIIEAIRLLGFSTDTIPVLSLGEEHWNLYSHTIANVSASRPAMKLGNAAAEILMDQLESPLAKETEKKIVPIPVNTNSQPKTVFSQPIEHSLSASRRLIKILMMDTPQVHALSNMAQNFENQTGVKTQIDILPHNQIYDEIINNHELSEPRYDVIMYDIPWLPMLASQGVLADISASVSSLDESIFLPGLLDHFSNFENSHYGIPFMYAPQIFYYRLDLFEDPALKAEYEKLYGLSLRPPVTLKEYNNLANFFTRQTSVINYGLSISAAYDECLAPEIYMRIQTYNGRIFDRQGNVVIDSPQSLKAYIHLMRSIKLAKPDFRQATDTSIVQDFIRGDTAMLITYPSFLTDLVDLRRSSMIGSIGYSLIPGRKPLLGGWGLGLSKHSKHKEDAFAFLEWSCSEQIANYMTVLGGNTAITSTYENDELTTLYPWLPLYLETYQYTSMTIPSDQGKIMNQNEVDAIVCKWIYKLMDQELDVVTALKNTQIELEELTNSTFV